MLPYKRNIYVNTNIEIDKNQQLFKFNYIPCVISFNDINKYIVSFIDTNQFPLADDKKQQIEKNMFSISKKNNKYVITLSLYTKFIDSIDVLIYLYTLIHNSDPLNKEVLAINNSILYVLINHTLPLILSNKLYKKYSLLMMSQLTKIVNDEIDNKISKIDKLSNELAQIKNIHKILIGKIDTVQKENNDWNIKENTKIDMLMQLIQVKQAKNISEEIYSTTEHVSSTIDKSNIYDVNNLSELKPDSSLLLSDNNSFAPNNTVKETNPVSNTQIKLTELNEPKISVLSDLELEEKKEPLNNIQNNIQNEHLPSNAGKVSSAIDNMLAQLSKDTKDDSNPIKNDVLSQLEKNTQDISTQKMSNMLNNMMSDKKFSVSSNILSLSQ